MNVETFNYSPESLAPFFYLNKRDRKNIYIFPTEKETLEFYNNFSNFVPESSYFPAWDTLSYDSFTPSLEIQGKRLQTLHSLLVNDSFDIAMSMKSFTQKIFINDLDVIDVQIGQEVDFENLIENLMFLGYVNKVRVESRGTFSIRGGQIDIYPLNSEYPTRIIFNGDEVIELKLFDFITQRSIKNIIKVLITPSSELFQTKQEDIFKSIGIEPNKDLDEYELFQFSQNLTNYKSLLDFVPDDISINIIDFNSCKETFSELQKIEEDSFNNLQKYFSLKVSKMKSRYVDAFLEINRYETMFYATNDLEDNALFLQDLYLDYAHELNEKASLLVTDRYRYSDQAVNDSGSNNQFAENVFKASVRYIIDQRNAVNTLINFTDRAYDNDSTALGATRDYEQVTFTPLYSRSLNRSGDTISLGYSITDHTLGHGAGGVDSSTLFVGYDRVFNPQFISSVQLGYTDAQIDQSGTDSDSTSPFFELGFNYRLSEKTWFNERIISRDQKNFKLSCYFRPKY